MTSLTNLRISFPNRETLEDILRSLQSQQHFRLLVNPQEGAMVSRDWSRLCEHLSAFVRANEVLPTGSSAHRQISEIRIQLSLPLPSPPRPRVIVPWGLVLELDRWEKELTVASLEIVYSRPPATVSDPSSRPIKNHDRRTCDFFKRVSKPSGTR
jgi:hypothetical protein